MDRIREVGPVETGDEHIGVTETELVADVLPYPLRGSGRKGDDRHVRELSPEGAQIPVVGTELVAPLRDAMGLVDRDQAYYYGVKEAAKRRRGQPFGRGIQHLQIAVERLTLDLTDLGG